MDRCVVGWVSLVWFGVNTTSCQQPAAEGRLCTANVNATVCMQGVVCLQSVGRGQGVRRIAVVRCGCLVGWRESVNNSSTLLTCSPDVGG